MPKKKTHSFTLVLEGTDVMEERMLDALFDAGCADALFGERDGLRYAEFNRKAPTFAQAVASAIEQVERVPGVRVLRVEPDELVTATVIAERTGRSREGVRLFIQGKRGPGGFPPPVAWVDAKTRLWQWSDVARWFDAALDQGLPSPEGIEFLAALNGALEVRRRAPRLQSDDERDVLANILGESGFFDTSFVEDSVAARRAHNERDATVPWSEVRG